MREYLMLWKWRFEQFQSVLGPAFYITTLSLLVYPFIAWRVPEWGVKFSFLFIWVVLLMAIMAAAWVWDRAQMWRYGQRVNVSRNQFQQGHLTPKEQLMLTRVHLPLMEAMGLDTREVRGWMAGEGLSGQSKEGGSGQVDPGQAGSSG